MERKRTNMFLLVMVVLLLQVFVPVLDTVSGETQTSGRSSLLHNENHSLIAPALLKEKEESENEVENLTVQLVQLIDFSDHSSFLSEYHQEKITPFTFKERINFRPLLFTLHRVFLI
jgi:hypothetical protein